MHRAIVHDGFQHLSKGVCITKARSLIGGIDHLKITGGTTARLELPIESQVGAKIVRSRRRSMFRQDSFNINRISSLNRSDGGRIIGTTEPQSIR